MLLYVGSFLLLLGPLVFVHELGHFLFAKLFNVRVDIFSMGFGPKIFKKKYGETEYCLSIVPLGGYVKLFGQDPTEVVTPELKKRSLNNLEHWKRFLVFIGGPLFNFLFAILVFAIMMMVGESHLSPVVGRVVPGSKAFSAGFHAGDVITAVNDSVVTRFEEVAETISTSAGKTLVFRVKRKGFETPSKEIFKEITVVPSPTSGLSIYGEVTEVGEIEGLSNFSRYTTVAVTNSSSDAFKAGLKTGDEIRSLNGAPVKSWEQLEDLMAQTLKLNKVKQISLGFVPRELKDWVGGIKNPAAGLVKEIILPLKNLRDLGIHSSELVVASMVPGSPAELAGLKPGDRLISIQQKTLQSFSDLRSTVQAVGETGEDISLQVERVEDGKTQLLVKTLKPTVQITPAESSALNAKETKQFLVGIYPLYVQAEPELFTERLFNPIRLTEEAWSRSIDLTVKTFISLKKLATRQVSVNTLGGPILIGKLAGDSMSRGASYFLKVMALISISLAVFNMLPVPVLDGGHIFLLLVEVIRGKPISLRSTEIVQLVGLSLIVFLLVVVLFNDFTRVGIPALKQMFQ